MDKNITIVLVVLMLCITFIALAVIGFDVNFEYDAPDGTSVRAQSTKPDTTIEDFLEQLVLTDNKIE